MLAVEGLVDGGDQGVLPRILGRDDVGRDDRFQQIRHRRVRARGRGGASDELGKVAQFAIYGNGQTAGRAAATRALRAGCGRPSLHLLRRFREGGRGLEALPQRRQFAEDGELRVELIRMQVLEVRDLDLQRAGADGERQLQAKPLHDFVQVVAIHLQRLARGQGFSDLQLTAVGASGKVAQQGDAKGAGFRRRPGGFGDGEISKVDVGSHRVRSALRSHPGCGAGGHLARRNARYFRRSRRGAALQCAS